MSTVFGILGLQNGEVANVVGLFPVLISCLAQHLQDSQLAVDADRKYLLKQEEEANCTTGGEYFFQELRQSRIGEKKPKTSFGGNKRALRRAFVVTSLAATYLIVTHLQANHAPQWFIWAIACVELFVTGQTVYWLTYWKPIVRWWQQWLRWLRDTTIAH
jgi:hypothetical protein